MIYIIYVACFIAGMVATLVFLATVGCSHSYQTRIHKVDHYYSDGTYRYTSWIYTNTCRHCGKVKVKNVGKR